MEKLQDIFPLTEASEYFNMKRNLILHLALKKLLVLFKILKTTSYTFKIYFRISETCVTFI